MNHFKSHIQCNKSTNWRKGTKEHSNVEMQQSLSNYQLVKTISNHTFTAFKKNFQNKILREMPQRD